MVEVAEASSTTDAASGSVESKSWWHRFGSAITAVVTVIAATIAVASSTVDVLYAVDPDSRPPEEVLATLARITVQQSVTYEQYLGKKGDIYVRYPHQDVGQLTEGDKSFPDPPMDRKGIVVLVKAEVRGVSNRLYSAIAELMDAKTNSTVVYNREKDSLLLSTCDIKMAAFKANGLTFRCWLHYPPVGTKYRVRVQLYAIDSHSAAGESGTELVDFIETADLTCCGPPQAQPGAPRPRVSVTS